MVFIFFFNDTATTEIYTLSLHDALPISAVVLDVYLVLAAHARVRGPLVVGAFYAFDQGRRAPRLGRRAVQERREAADRKSTRLNSSHANISYAVFCLKKKKKTQSRL